VKWEFLQWEFHVHEIFRCILWLEKFLGGLNFRSISQEAHVPSQHIDINIIGYNKFFMRKKIKFKTQKIHTTVNWFDMMTETIVMKRHHVIHKKSHLSQKSHLFMSEGHFISRDNNLTEVKFFKRSSRKRKRDFLFSYFHNRDLLIGVILLLSSLLFCFPVVLILHSHRREFVFIPNTYL